MRANKVLQSLLFAMQIVLCKVSWAAELSKHDMLKKQIADVVLSVAEENDIPAISIGTVRNGELFYVHSIGHTLRKSAIQINEHTLFQVASLSKLFTGIIANHLIDLGLLEPEKSVLHYLDQKRANTNDHILHDVTVNMLLQHQSGITDDVCSLYKSRQEGRAWTAGYSRELLLDDIQSMPQSQLASGIFHYSSCGYAILALVLEVAAAKTYEELLDELVDNKLGLSSTQVFLEKTSDKRVAMPYLKSDRDILSAVSVMGIASGASAIYSSVSDLVRLQIQQMKAYRAPFSSVANKSLLLTENTEKGPQENIRYGYGLMQIQLPTGMFYGHDGDADGYASFYIFSPERNIGLVILTSSGGEWVFPLAFDLIGMLAE
ncbi:MAG: serine hydrolase domain-containing protein [Granulosicoccus sp.]